MTLYLYNQDGQLSAYGLACGYIMRRYSGKVCVSLWQEHGTYHVRGVYCKGDRKGDRAFWQTFGKLTEARRCFYEPCLQDKLAGKNHLG